MIKLKPQKCPRCGAPKQEIEKGCTLARHCLTCGEEKEWSCKKCFYSLNGDEVNLGYWNKDKEYFSKLKVSELAKIVFDDWARDICLFAKSYLDAMLKIEQVGSMYGTRSASGVIKGFLNGSEDWKTETGKKVRAELQKRLDRHFNEEVMFKNIYLDVDGVIVLDDLVNHGRGALNLALFLIKLGKLQADGVLKLHWLTTHCKNGDDTQVLEYLKKQRVNPSDLDLIKEINIQPTTWNNLKTEAIDFSQDFIWFDDELYPEELEVLKKHNAEKNFFQINLQKDKYQLRNIAHSFSPLGEFQYHIEPL